MSFTRRLFASPSSMSIRCWDLNLAMIFIIVIISFAVVSVDGLTSSEIPRQTSYDNATGECGRTEFPGAMLGNCTDPIDEGIPDIRGWWQWAQLPTQAMFEQCGNRFAQSQIQLDYQGRWTARDFVRLDGTTVYDLFHARSFPDCVPLPATARFENGCRIIEGEDLLISFCQIRPDVISWQYEVLGEQLQDMLIRMPDGPRVSTTLFNAATNQRLGEFPTNSLNVERGALGMTLDLCVVGTMQLTMRVIAPGATKVKFRITNSSATESRTVMHLVEKEEPFMLGGGVKGQPLPVDALKTPGNYTLVVLPKPGFPKIRRDFVVQACEMGM